MFQVSKMAAGTPTIRRGPCHGCVDFHRFAWVTVGTFRSRAAAVAKADSCCCRAVVTRTDSSETLYENCQEPADLADDSVRDAFLG